MIDKEQKRGFQEGRQGSSRNEQRYSHCASRVPAQCWFLDLTKLAKKKKKKKKTKFVSLEVCENQRGPKKERAKEKARVNERTRR